MEVQSSFCPPGFFYQGVATYSYVSYYGLALPLCIICGIRVNEVEVCHDLIVPNGTIKWVEDPKPATRLNTDVVWYKRNIGNIVRSENKCWDGSDPKPYEECSSVMCGISFRDIRDIPRRMGSIALLPCPPDHFASLPMKTHEIVCPLGQSLLGVFVGPYSLQPPYHESMCAICGHHRLICRRGTSSNKDHDFFSCLSQSCQYCNISSSGPEGVVDQEPGCGVTLLTEFSVNAPARNNVKIIGCPENTEHLFDFLHPEGSLNRLNILLLVLLGIFSVMGIILILYYRRKNGNDDVMARDVDFQPFPTNLPPDIDQGNVIYDYYVEDYMYITKIQ